jgi:hypothetical protein
MGVRLAVHPLTSSTDLRLNRQSLAGAVCCELFRIKLVIASAAKQSILPRTIGDNGLLRSARNDVACTEYNSAISRRDAPEVFKNQSRRNKEGAGNAGCALHPRSRVQKSVEAHTSIQGSGEHPTFPAQWFYGLCRALPGDEFILPPSPAD